MALPKKLKNFNLFLDSESYAGRATEISLPKLARKMEDFNAGGMAGPIEIDMGQEKLEGEVTLAEFSRKVLETYGVTSADGVKLRFRGAAVNDGTTSATDAIEIVMHGRFKEIDMGAIKNAENTEMKLSYGLTYFKYILNGEVIIEIDMLGMVLMVNGVDRLEEQREALAL